MRSSHVQTVPLASPIGRDVITRFKGAGFYRSTIARYTGLTIGQVQYRLAKYGLIVPRAFARGEDEKAHVLVSQAKTLIAKIEAAKQRAIEEKELERLQKEGRHD